MATDMEPGDARIHVEGLTASTSQFSYTKLFTKKKKITIESLSVVKDIIGYSVLSKGKQKSFIFCAT